MNTFKNFLKTVKHDAVSTQKPLRLVMGNTSGDMDSIVGALGLAYFYTLKTGEQWTPVVNCNKADFHCKAEIYLHTVVHCGLDPETFLFWDELVALKRHYSQIALIDHNLLDGGNEKDLGQDAASKVTHIIDHHFDNNAYPASQLQENTVRFIGSACSLVALQMRDNLHLFSPQHWAEGTRNFAYFFAAAVALDTYNFRESLRGNKWTEEDAEAWTFLKQYYPFTDEYFELLCEAKFDQEVNLRLGLRGIFTRDYKNYLMSNEECAGKLGMSVTNLSVERLLEHFGKEALCSAIEEYMGARELSMFGLCCDVHQPTGPNKRYIMMYSTHRDSFANSLPKLVKAIDASTTVQASNCVKGDFGDATYAYWDVNNLSLSRKKFEAFLKTIYTH